MNIPDTKSNPEVEQLDLIEKIQTHAQVFFSHVARGVALEDREDIVQAACLALAKGQHNPDRSDVNTYCQRLIGWAYKAHGEQAAMNAERQRVASASLLESLESEGIGALLLDDQDRGLIRSSDPFDPRSVMSPSYRVEFSTEYDLDTYVSEPYFVPEFELVPANASRSALARDHNGMYRAKDLRKLTSTQCEALEAVRRRFAIALCAMVSEYVEDFGWRSLPSPQRRTIAGLNKGKRPVDIQRELGITQSTYYAYLKVIQRRGWQEEWHGKKGHNVYRYHPVRDGDRKLHDGAAPVNTSGLKLKDRIEAADLAPTESEIMGHVSAPQAVGSFIAKLARELDRASFEVEALVAYDVRLRAFVDRLIRRPILTDGRTFEEVMAVVVGLPSERQKSLIFDAIKRQKSIGDLLSLGDYFPEVCYASASFEWFG